MRWHTEGAHNPSDRGANRSVDHLVLDEPLRTGRLVRAAGDPLCKPAKKFWGLTGPRREPVVSCHLCAKQALRLGLPFEGRCSLDMGRSWYATLVIEAGQPRSVQLRSRWFGHPPPLPPEPPSEGYLLREVRAIVPKVRAVRIDRLEPTGYNEAAGFALVEADG